MGHQKKLVSESTLGGAGNPTIHEPLYHFDKTTQHPNNIKIEETPLLLYQT